MKPDDAVPLAAQILSGRDRVRRTPDLPAQALPLCDRRSQLEVARHAISADRRGNPVASVTACAAPERGIRSLRLSRRIGCCCRYWPGPRA